MKKILTWAVLCVVLLFVISTWDPIAYMRVYWAQLHGEQTPVNPIARATIAPIAPQAQSGQTDQVRVTLYFRYGATAYLGQEAYEISVPRDSTLEKAIVSALLEGPDGRHGDLTNVFPEGTRVLETSRSGDTVSVTLSAQFLAAPSGAPDNWQEDAYWAKEIPLRRRLALEAIVLSLTEDARCRSVQLLVGADEGLSAGERVASEVFYPDAANAAEMLSPVSRDESSVFTPRNATTAALLLWQAKEFESLYAMLGASPYTEDIQLPTQGEFAQEAAHEACSLLAFNVSGGNVSPEGLRATVVIDLQYTNAQGSRVRLDDVPLSLYRENDNWKISYGDMIALMRRK